MDSPHQEVIHALVRRGFIQPRHAEQALNDPRLDELKVAPTEDNALVWLVARGILLEEEFAEMASNLRMTKVGAEYRDCQRVVDEATQGLNALRLHINQETLDTLLSVGVIDQAMHDTASARLEGDRAFGSPAALLAWMRLSDLISAEQMQALRDRVKSQAGFASGAQAAEIVAQADETIGQAHKLARRAATSAVFRGIFPGPPLAWAAAFLALVGWGVWSLVTPASVPTCESDSTGKTVSAMLFRAQTNARANILSGGRSEPFGFPQVSNLREVGFARAERSRGCLATVTVGELRVPFAFTISPATAKETSDGGNGESSRSGFLVAGGDARIIQARYGHIDEQGRFAQQALPLGRAKLEKAFRDGVDGMNQSASDSGATALQRMRARHPLLAGKAAEETRRTREIAEIEPLAPCVEAAPNRRVCRLMIERNDPLLEAMGASGSIVFEGDFTFERDEVGEGWHVSADAFTKEFQQAAVAGRIAEITGVPAEGPGATTAP
jgi:hypothetical protein